MVRPLAGEVVVVPFPFSDLSQSKVRPAVCLAAVGRDDWVMCQVTSNPYGDPLAIALKSQDFVSGGLSVDSFARPGKLFTANSALLIRSKGRLTPVAFDRLIADVVSIFRPAVS